MTSWQKYEERSYKTSRLSRNREKKPSIFKSTGKNFLLGSNSQPSLSEPLLHIPTNLPGDSPDTTPADVISWRGTKVADVPYFTVTRWPCALLLLRHLSHCTFMWHYCAWHLSVNVGVERHITSLTFKDKKWQQKAKIKGLRCSVYKPFLSAGIFWEFLLRRWTSRNATDPRGKRKCLAFLDIKNPFWT